MVKWFKIQRLRGIHNVGKVHEDLARGISIDTSAFDQERGEIVISHSLEDVGLGENSGELEHRQVKGSDEETVTWLP